MRCTCERSAADSTKGKVRPALSRSIQPVPGLTTIPGQLSPPIISITTTKLIPRGPCTGRHGPMQRSSDVPFYAQARAHIPACCSSDHITFVVNPSATSSRRLERVTHNAVTTANINYRNLTISYACCAVLLNKSRYQVVSRAFDLASSMTIGHLPTLAKLISTFTRCFTLITFESNVRFPLGIVTAKEVDQDYDNLKYSNTEQDVRLLHPQDPERNGVTRATHLVRV